MGSAWDLDEVPEVAIDQYQHCINAANAVAMVVDPVCMGFASRFEVTHEDFQRVFDLHAVYPDPCDIPYFFKDIAGACRANKRVLDGISQYLDTYKTAVELGSFMRTNTLALQKTLKISSWSMCEEPPQMPQPFEIQRRCRPGLIRNSWQHCVPFSIR